MARKIWKSARIARVPVCDFFTAGSAEMEPSVKGAKGEIEGAPLSRRIRGFAATEAHRGSAAVDLHVEGAPKALTDRHRRRGGRGGCGAAAEHHDGAWCERSTPVGYGQGR